MAKELPDTETIKYTLPDVCTEAAIKKKILEYRKLYPLDLRDDRTLRPMAVRQLMQGRKP